MGLLQTASSISVPQDENITPLSSLEEYPVASYQFSVYIKDVNAPVALFQTVSGLEVKREVDSLAEGGMNEFGREFPKGMNYSHITFGIGLTSNDFFYKWMMTGKETGRPTSKDFTLVQKRHNPKGGKDAFVEVKRWDFHKAFPVSWKLPDLDISSSEAIVVESLELSFEFFEAGKTA